MANPMALRINGTRRATLFQEDIRVGLRFRDSKESSLAFLGLMWSVGRKGWIPCGWCRRRRLAPTFRIGLAAGETCIRGVRPASWRSSTPAAG